MTRRVLAWGPAATWAAVLFFVSSQPSLPVDLASGMDKVAHFGAYLVLGFLASFGAAVSRLPLKVAALLCLAYGLSDELHQSIVPGRDASLGDWVADAAGAAVGTLLYFILLRWRGALGSRTDLQGARTT